MSCTRTNRATISNMGSRVLIVDDHPSFRRFATRLLEMAGFSVVGEAEDGASALAAVRRLRPELVLLDVLLPDMSGFAVADALAARSTARGSCSSRAGARPSSGRSRGVVAGGVVVDPSLVAQLLDRRRRADPLDELTPREREVLALMAEGLTDRGIAQRLYVTPKTIETHARHIFQKLSLPESALENKRVRAVLTYLRA